ncbi:MAG TPA: NrsF family protein [Vicinamibacterales bacterium]|nr:NrsF family protein [Vicinamibacterales bacterium]
MRTEDLIVDLAWRVTPVRPLARPAVRAFRWLIVAGTCVVLGIGIFGARGDVTTRLIQADYFWTVALALILAIVAAVTSLTLAIPGAERRPALRITAVALLCVWALTIVWSVIRAGHGLPIATDPHWPVCFARVFLVAAIPAYVLAVMVRRAFPLRPGWTAAMISAAAASAGALMTQLACPLDDPGHGLLGHFVPVLALIAMGLSAKAVVGGARREGAERRSTGDESRE